MKEKTQWTIIAIGLMIAMFVLGYSIGAFLTAQDWSRNERENVNRYNSAIDYQYSQGYRDGSHDLALLYITDPEAGKTFSTMTMLYEGTNFTHGWERLKTSQNNGGNL